MRSDTPQPKLSVSLALEGLKEASEAVRQAESTLAEARALRDAYIADMMDVIPITKISRISGLSRQSIYKLRPGRG